MPMTVKLGYGRKAGDLVEQNRKSIEYLNFKLASRGLPIFGRVEDYPLLSMSGSMIQGLRLKNRQSQDVLCPVDRRIADFLEEYLGDVPDRPSFRIPGDALVLEHHGLARVLSLPPDRDEYHSDIISSYRVQQGVLHNPRSDRRTTQGVFHVCEGGLPVPADKKSVPKPVFAALLAQALNPPESLLALPFLETTPGRGGSFVSLLLRPTVSPGVPGYAEEKSMEVRFFAPGNLVSNLDFVESIFGNAGDPFVHDAALDAFHWSGHTGCVILAPHLTALTKRELGLPHFDQATDRQKRDGMCWREEREKYNEGGAFKITARDRRGIIVTLIADNYFGYCKKEVKTQISYAANLMGQAEEEHAGGAIAFRSYDLGGDFQFSNFHRQTDHTFAENLPRLGTAMELQPEGYGVDRMYPDILYLPENARISVEDNAVEWEKDGQTRRLNLLAGTTYMMPSGYKVELVRPSNLRRWRLMGTHAEGTFCHKPCTVSGGGKSEISKSIADAILTGPVFTADYERDFELVQRIIDTDFSTRFRDSDGRSHDSRPLLSPERSLGSVIKLLTPSPEYSEPYNEWIRSIPLHVRDLVLVVKRLHKPGAGTPWREQFGVDFIDGKPGNELKYNDQKLFTQYLRVGYDPQGNWRVFTLRKDFMPSAKLQTEDDISASLVVPAGRVANLNAHYRHPSVKFVANCEYRFFQRPDDAIHRGYDRKAEEDFAGRDSFFSNYEPLPRGEIRAMTEHAPAFDKFTTPMKRTLRAFVSAEGPAYAVSPDAPRIVDGKRTKNPRYLQNRPDIENPRHKYLFEMGVRLFRKMRHEEPVPLPVNAVLAGRRNNAPEPGVRALCVYGPIHYQELPELFMDYIASLTGKSPSTTGAGSEGALTKGPFNALPPVYDLNSCLLSYIMTGYDGFTSAAGKVGPNYEMGHDISLLVPEIWARMGPEERDPAFLLASGALEKVSDFEHNGHRVAASRLGYRITEKFVRTYLGRVFSNPESVFTAEMLRPETQDPEIFADGMDNICSTMRTVAENYFADGSVAEAIAPIRALLHIMAHGHWEGTDVQDPEIRRLFDRQTVLESDWYRERLKARQKIEVLHWDRIEKALTKQLAQTVPTDDGEELIRKREWVRQKLAVAQSPGYPMELSGTIGAEPGLCPQA
ncbi:MAG: hypothetical protein SFY92_06415 [Verrucomicrobiae bacterium]|nr:hypothetical protein [Verrucomicrobiae bacterium]